MLQIIISFFMLMGALAFRAEKPADSVEINQEYPKTATAELADISIEFRLAADGPIDNSEIYSSPDSDEDLYVYPEVYFDENDISYAWVELNSMNQALIYVEFYPYNIQKLAELTNQNIGKRIAIIVDGELVSAPVIQTEINSGTILITGAFTYEEAMDVVNRLGF